MNSTPRACGIESITKTRTRDEQHDVAENLKSDPSSAQVQDIVEQSDKAAVNGASMGLQEAGSEEGEAPIKQEPEAEVVKKDKAGV